MIDRVGWESGIGMGRGGEEVFDGAEHEVESERLGGWKV